MLFNRELYIYDCLFCIIVRLLYRWNPSQGVVIVSFFVCMNVLGNVKSTQFNTFHEQTQITSLSFFRCGRIMCCQNMSNYYLSIFSIIFIFVFELLFFAVRYDSIHMSVYFHECILHTLVRVHACTCVCTVWAHACVRILSHLRMHLCISISMHTSTHIS